MNTNPDVEAIFEFNGVRKNSVKDHTGPFCNVPVSHQSLSGYDYDEDQMRRGIQDRKAAFQQI